MDIKKWVLFGGVGACGALCIASSAGVLTMLSVGAIASYFTNPFLSFGGVFLLSALAWLGYRHYKRSLLTNQETKSDVSMTKDREKCCS